MTATVAATSSSRQTIVVHYLILLSFQLPQRAEPTVLLETFLHLSHTLISQILNDKYRHSHCAQPNVLGLVHHFFASPADETRFEVAAAGEAFALTGRRAAVLRRLFAVEAELLRAGSAGELTADAVADGATEDEADCGFWEVWGVALEALFARAGDGAPEGGALIPVRDTDALVARAEDDSVWRGALSGAGAVGAGFATNVFAEDDGAAFLADGGAAFGVDVGVFVPETPEAGRFCMDNALGVLVTEDGALAAESGRLAPLVAAFGVDTADAKGAFDEVVFPAFATEVEDFSGFWLEEGAEGPLATSDGRLPALGLALPGAADAFSSFVAVLVGIFC